MPDALSRAPHVSAQPIIDIEGVAEASIGLLKGRTSVRPNTILEQTDMARIRITRALQSFAANSADAGYNVGYLQSVIVEPTFLQKVSQA